MFKLTALSARQAKNEMDTLKNYPLLRTSSYLANFLAPNNTLVVTEIAKWIKDLRDIRSGSGTLLIGIPVDADTCSRWFPNQTVESAWEIDNGYVAMVKRDLYVIASPTWNSYPYETDPTNEYEILGKVEVGGIFSPCIAPKYGFIIRAMSEYDYRQYVSKGFESPYPPIVEQMMGHDYEQPMPVMKRNHNFSVYLVPGEGQMHPTDYIKNYDNVIDKLDLGVEESDLGKLLVNWKYPNTAKVINTALTIDKNELVADIDEEEPVRERSLPYRYSGGELVKSISGYETEWKRNSGIIYAYPPHNGDYYVVIKCQPGLEVPLIRTLSQY